MIKKLHHVAIAVRSLEDNLRFFEEHFGLKPSVMREIPDQGVKAALLPAGDVEIELLEPIDPNGTVARFIQRQGEAMHHICFETDNVAEELRRFTLKGFELVDRVPRPGLAGTIAFLHPRSTRGILTELAQISPQPTYPLTTKGRPIRVLVAKPGLDGHDRGAKVVARALRDAGMEVIYTGIRQSPEMIAEAALQEDVDVIGLSILSGAHMGLLSRIMDQLKRRGLGDTLVFAGGIIPEEDEPGLKQMGVGAIFRPGAATIDIIDTVRSAVAEKIGFQETGPAVHATASPEAAIFRPAAPAPERAEPGSYAPAAVPTPSRDGRKVRVLVAKPGLDGHDRGAKIVARALRDAGMEVIYTGIRQSPEMIAEAALQEDVDAVGLSILSGAHMDLFPRIIEQLKRRGMEDVVVFAGGIIPEEDEPALKQLGVTAIFRPGTTTGEIVEFVNKVVAEKVRR